MATWSAASRSTRPCLALDTYKKFSFELATFNYLLAKRLLFSSAAPFRTLQRSQTALCCQDFHFKVRLAQKCPRRRRTGRRRQSGSSASTPQLRCPWRLGRRSTAGSRRPTRDMIITIDSADKTAALHDKRLSGAVAQGQCHLVRGSARRARRRLALPSSACRSEAILRLRGYEMNAYRSRMHAFSPFSTRRMSPDQHGRRQRGRVARHMTCLALLAAASWPT